MRILSMLLIPLCGTVAGSTVVFFVKNSLNCRVKKLLNGFAAGVMLAASVWSLLIPAIEIQGADSSAAWLPVTAGFLAGIFLLMLLSRAVLRLNCFKKFDSGFAKTAMLIFAVTIHNFPEGMAAGVTFAGSDFISVGQAVALSLGLAVQNFPEGAIVSLPLRNAGFSKLKSFALGFLSGVVEPIGALLTVFLAAQLTALLPFLLSFAAGAMIYVVVDELIPDSGNGDSTLTTAGTAAGFVLMMILDVAL